MTLYPLTLQCCHRRSQDFLCGGALLSPKKLMTSFYSSPYGRCYSSYTANTYLFMSSAGVHFTIFSPIFASFPQKMLRKFFRHPGGAPAPPAPPCLRHECCSHGGGRRAAPANFWFQNNAYQMSYFKAKCTKIDFGWGSAPDPAGGAYSGPPNP